MVLRAVIVTGGGRPLRPRVDSDADHGTAGELIEGSYRESLMRCGRQGCHCNDKPAHLVTRVSRWEDRKLKNKVVRIEDRVIVEKLVENYREHKQTISKLAKLNEKEGAILKSIVNRKKKRYE